MLSTANLGSIEEGIKSHIVIGTTYNAGLKFFATICCLLIGRLLKYIGRSSLNEVNRLCNQDEQRPRFLKQVPLLQR